MMDQLVFQIFLEHLVVSLTVKLLLCVWHALYLCSLCTLQVRNGQKGQARDLAVETG